MKCRKIDNQFGGLICFFSNEYGNTSSDLEINEEDIIYTKVLFTDNSDETILPYMQNCTFPGKIDICFCYPNKKGIAEAIELRQSNAIRDIYITPNCFYSCNELDCFIGFESWYEMWAPASLRPVDETSRTISDVADLAIKAGYIAETIAAANPRSDLEKIILTDAWLQKNVQFATGKESFADGGKYICETISQDSNAHDPLLHGYGRCQDIAFSAALILNNPALGVNCRQVGASKPDGFNHSWNIVRCNDREYYTDFTHNISRNPHRAEGALRATSYSNQFTLLGIKDAQSKYGVTELYSHKNISIESFDRREIEETILTLKSLGVLETTWDTDPIIPSVFIKQR